MVRIFADCPGRKELAGICLAVAILSSSLQVILLLNGIRSVVLLLPYLISICFLLFFCRSLERSQQPLRLGSSLAVLFSRGYFWSTPFFVLLPLMVRVILFEPELLHQDEFILAYHSYHLDLLSLNLFGGFPVPIWEWVGQTPFPYWVYQHLLLLLLGPSYISIKLLNVPIILAISLFLFLFTKEVAGRRVAQLTLLCYAALAPAIYFDQLVINNHASTVAILLWSWLAVLDLRLNRPLLAGLLGLATAFGLLVYQSSYLLLPALLLLLGLKIYRFPGQQVASNGLISILAIILVLIPFAAEKTVEENNMFFLRLKRVAEMGIAKEEFSIAASVKNTVDSFYKDGVGGSHQGFFFGRKRLFTTVVILAALLGLFSQLTRRHRISGSGLAIFFLGCHILFGMTIFSPVPAFERAISMLVFVAFFSGLGFVVALRVFQKKAVWRMLLLSTFVSVYIISNLRHYNQALAADFVTVSSNRQDLHSIKFIIANIAPDLPLQFIGPINWHYRKMFFFFAPTRKVNQRPWQEALLGFNATAPYLYLIALFRQEAWDLIQFLSESDKNARIVGEHCWKRLRILTNLDLAESGQSPN